MGGGGVTVGTERETAGRSEVFVLVCMLAAVGAFSVLPLGVMFSGGSSAPFLLSCFLRLGGVAGCGVFLLVFYRRILFSAANLRVVCRGLFCWPDNRLMLITLVGTGDLFCFSLAVRFLDIAVVAVLYELYPVVIIFLASRVFQGDGVYRRFSLWTKGFVGLSIAGFLLAVVSQEDGFVDFLSHGTVWKTALGVLLALGSVVGTGVSVLGWRWGWDVGGNLSGGAGVNSGVLCGMVVCLVFTSLVSCLVSGVLGLGLGESVDWKLVVFGLLTGLFVVAVGPIFYRKGNLLGRNVGINALGYLVPALSVMWLYWFGGVGVARWDYLVGGMALIVGANLMINFELAVRRTARRVFRNPLVALYKIVLLVGLNFGA